MTEEVERLLALSREARWTFPSSLGGPVRKGEGADAWLEQLVGERESFLEAARFLIESGDDEGAVEFAANVWRLWVMSGEPAAVLDGGEGKPSRARALALYGDGLVAYRQGAIDGSRRRNEAAVEVARAVDDPEAPALAHLGLSRVALEDGEHERARELAVRACDYARGLGAAMGQAPLHMHAQATRLAGDYDEAAALFAESLDLNRRIGDQGMVEVELQNLGHVEIHRGNTDAEERCFAELAQLGSSDEPYGEAMTHLNQAVFAFARGDHDRAATLLARAQSILEKSGVEPSSDDRFEIGRLREQLQLGGLNP